MTSLCLAHYDQEVTKYQNRIGVFPKNTKASFQDKEKLLKSLKESVGSLFHGKVENISATEFRANIGECLTQTSMGKTFCIKRKGKIVAYLTLDVDIIHEVSKDGVCETLESKK